MPSRRLVLTVLASAALVACGSEPVPEPTIPSSVGRGPRVSFSYPTIDGGTLSTNDVAGRFTVLGFVATYDDKSHAQARFLSVVVRRHVPRINAGIVVLEPEENRLLIETFAKVLEAPYPVAIADEATIAGNGPFVGLHHVPSVVILDPEGREAWRHLGPADNHVIDAVLKALEEGKTPPY